MNEQGGEGVTFHDTKPGNKGGTFRHDYVEGGQVNPRDPSMGLGWILSGELLGFTVDLSAAGTHGMTPRIPPNRRADRSRSSSTAERHPDEGRRSGDAPPVPVPDG